MRNALITGRLDFEEDFDGATFVRNLRSQYPEGNIRTGMSGNGEHVEFIIDATMDPKKIENGLLDFLKTDANDYLEYGYFEMRKFIQSWDEHRYVFSEGDWVIREGAAIFFTNEEMSIMNCAIQSMGEDVSDVIKDHFDAKLNRMIIDPDSY